MSTPTLTPARGKQPLTKLAGPYGHPFHPILVTIPIGAWVASLVFDIVSHVNGSGSPSLVDAAQWLIAIGLIGAVAAAVFGLLDLLAVPTGSRAFRIGLTHMVLNLGIVALFVADFFWRHSQSHQPARAHPGQLALSAVGIAVLLVSGWLGGMLSYRFGVRVADEVTQREGFDRR